MSDAKASNDGPELNTMYQVLQAQDFRYEPLPASSGWPMIRLLELIPSTDTKTLLEFNLILVTLFNNMIFDALSYCWGG